MGSPSDQESADREELLRTAALMVHQLKSPVSSASSLLSAVLGEYAGALTPRQRRLLEKAASCIDESTTAMERMLEIVAPGGEDESSAHACDLLAVLQAAEMRFRPRAEQRGISLTLSPTAARVYVQIREAALAEALNALLSNAIKYTPDNGSVVLDITEPDDPERIEVSVSDSGMGISEASREEIFEPFFRTKSAEGSERPGVGLGLSFVRSVVEKFGGRIWCSDSPLGGASFVFELRRLSDRDWDQLGGEQSARPFRVVIIGGVTAGSKAAAKIVRLLPEAEVTVVEKGRFLAYSGCGLPAYVAGRVTDQRELMSTPAGTVRDPVFFQKVKNIHVLNLTEATVIDRQQKQVRIRKLSGGEETWIPYDKLLLCTGALPVVPAIPGIDMEGVFTLQGVRDAEGIRAALQEGAARDVVVIGGGLLGLAMTTSFVERGSRVTIVELKDQILGRIFDWEMARLVERHLERHGVKVLTRTRISRIGSEGSGKRLTGVETNRGLLPADMVIVAAGVRPNVDLARQAGLAVSAETRAIRVDDYLHTSDPDILAAGDCVGCRDLVSGHERYAPVGSIANKHARIAAVNICGGEAASPGVLGTSICNCFDYTVGRTGLSENEARDLGMNVITVLVPGPDRDHYLPEARMIYLKLVVETPSGRLLGAQATGPGDCDKRIDVAATAITAGMTVSQIAHIDLAYAPAYSPVMDNLITAAQVARNKLDGTLSGITPAELKDRMDRGCPLLLLDVRGPQEAEEQRLPGAVLAPLSSLRARIDDLPRDKPVVTYSGLSLRGYEASLILQAAGFEQVRVLDGGIAMWPYANA